NTRLPWFWSMDVRQETDVGEWVEDSKAQKTRWVEELQCLQVEMESAVMYLKHQERAWQDKGETIDSQPQPGHAAWMARQSAMWCSMAAQAESPFTAL
ncbi:hypothetical protein EI94DRAFT_1476930, partial [Lactarius quietus]